MTLRPNDHVNTFHTKRRRLPPTLWTKSNADSVGQDVDTLEDAGTSVIAKLDFLVGTTRELLVSCSGCRTTNSARRGGGETVHSGKDRYELAEQRSDVEYPAF